MAFGVGSLHDREQTARVAGVDGRHSAMIDKAMGKRLPHGSLIVFEGIDGAGKTTQAKRLVDGVRAAGVPALYGKEPTDGSWGKRIRLSAEGERMPMEEELHAFIEDRREHVVSIISPALDNGIVVVLDRYYFSNAAYQGARGADVAEIIRRNEEFAPKPDLLIFLDVPVDIGMQRVHARGYGVSSFERADALEKSADIFHSFKQPFVMCVDGQRPIDDIAGEVLEVVTRGILAAAIEDGLPPLPREQVSAALAAVERIRTDERLPAEQKAEAVRREIHAILQKPKPS